MKITNSILVLPLLILAACGPRNRVQTGLEGKPMPDFSLLLTDSATHFSTRSIPVGKPVVLFAFSPICPYSRDQMRQIISNINNLKDIRFYVLSNGDFQSMKLFSNYYHLERYPNITVGLDTGNYFSKYYDAAMVPYLAVFNRNKVLTQALLGETDIRIIEGIAKE